MRTLLAVVLLVVGCTDFVALSTEPKPGQEAAQRLAFELLGGEPRHVPIAWVEGPGLNCRPLDDRGTPEMMPAGEEGVGFFEATTGLCVSGVLLRNRWGNTVMMALSWRHGMRTAVDSAILHETCHDVIGDDDHLGACMEDGPLLTGLRALMHELLPPPAVSD